MTAATVGALCAAPSIAFAADDRATAALLSREAEDLLADGKVAEACVKLDKSQRLDPRDDTLLDLALCHEKEGKIATAFREFEAAEKIAKKSDRAMTARLHKKRLFLRLPRLTTHVPAAVRKKGIHIEVNGEPVPPTMWSKPRPVDPGEVVVVAMAEDNYRWEEKLTMKVAQQRAIQVGVLKQVAPPPPPKEDPKEEPKEDPKEEPKEDPKEEPKEEPPSGEKIHEDGRLVVDLGAIVGFLFSKVDQASLDEVNGTQYSYFGASGSEFLAACGDTESVPGAGDCEATFNAASNLIVGGQLFVGWGFTDSFQLGGRGFITIGFPEAFSLFGGPSFSLNVDGPLWLGGTFLVGTQTHLGDVTGALGSVPEELEAQNGGSEVEIQKNTLRGGLAEGTVEPGLMLGGAIEISYNLTDWKPADFMAGSLMLSAWPGFAVGVEGNGFNISVPVGIGYRFY